MVSMKNSRSPRWRRRAALILVLAVAAGVGVRHVSRRRAPPAPPPPPVPAAAPRVHRVMRVAGPVLAICMDDFGFSLKSARRVCALPCRLTCAIIPLTGFATKTAEMAAAVGKEVFIHMPMQPTYRLPDVPEYSVVIGAGLSPDEIADRIARARASVPGAAGMNNHEGSLATEDPELMAHVMAVLGPLEFCFLDSMTTVNTTAWKAARDAGLCWGKNGDFLDADRSPPAIEAVFARAVARARRRGRAIIIGHAWSANTIDALERLIPAAQAEGITFVPVTELLTPGRASASGDRTPRAPGKPGGGGP